MGNKIGKMEFYRTKAERMVKKTVLYGLFVLATLEVACQEKIGDNKAVAQPVIINKTIGVDEFEKKLDELKNVQLIDVRTSGEFAEGHLKNAQNIDWRDAAFAEQAAKLNKNAPVMVYCLGGGRSAAAAAKLEEMGFTTIYDMDGGYLGWSSSNKPVVGANDPDVWKGMTQDEFLKQVSTDKYALVDFTAKWCRPCQEMMPMLEKVAAEKKDKLTFVRVDADANKSLLKAKRIDAIPYFELYKAGKLVWTHQGAISEQTLLKETGL